MHAHPAPEEVRPRSAATMRRMPRKASTAKGPRPAQGARLLALREASGLTQIELAKALGVPHSNIAHWEWSDKPPRADLLPHLAQILNVTLEDLVGPVRTAERAATKRPGPVGELQRTFEAVRKLPRKQQRKIIEVVNALVTEYQRSADGRAGRSRT